jgi:hypothetical protein
LGAIRLSAARRWGFSLVLVALLWLAVEGVCLGGLRALAGKGLVYRPPQAEELAARHRAALGALLADEKASIIALDPRLGWTLRPHGRKQRNRINGAGIRADRELAARPAPGRLRIAAFGDSFTYSSDVPNGRTWADFLELLLPRSEVLNFGVPGYGLDQAYLRYLDPGVKFHPDVVFAGFMSENVERGVNTFRPFYYPETGMPFAKPRFTLRGEGLELRPNPLPTPESYRELLADPRRVLPRLGRHDVFYRRFYRRAGGGRLGFLPSARFLHVLRTERFDRPSYAHGVYDVRSEAFQVASRTFDLFVRDVRRRRSLPVILLFPQRRDLLNRREGRPDAYGPLRDSLRQRGYLVVDLLEAFARHDPEGTLLRRKFVHYPARGNRMVAQYLADWLTANALLTRETVRARVR